MRDQFLDAFMDRIGFPDQAKQFLNHAEDTLFSFSGHREKTAALARDFFARQRTIEQIIPQLDEMAKAVSLSEYTVHLLFLLSCTHELFDRYRVRAIPEEIFWDSMHDFTCKLHECYEVKGVWGVFVATWYPRFFHMTRFALGRFQYESFEFPFDRYERNGIIIKKGDTVYNSHIPSSGSMPYETRIDSYRRAYQFYEKDLGGKPIAIICKTWLLYPPHREFLPETSNIRGFMDDFDIIETEEPETFSDAWRIFGKHHELPYDRLPTDTSLRRAYAERLKSGGKTGVGFGILLFDGTKII